MPVAVAQPQRDSSDNQALLSALGIARDLFKVGMDERQQARHDQMLAEQAKGKESEDARKQTYNFNKDYEIVPEGTPNSVSANDANLGLPSHLKIPAGQAMRLRTYGVAEQQAGDKSSNKTEEDYKQAHQHTLQMLTTGRGDPGYSQAEKDLYAAKKADSLVNLYGDPNKLSQQQVNLLASEISKIASGGAPSQHDFDQISSGSLTGKLSQYVSRLTNDPTPANAAAFIRQYQDYTNALANDARGVIRERNSSVISSNQSRLRPRDVEALNKEWVDRFKNPEYPKKVRNPQSGETATVSNEQEFKEAQDAGFR